MPAQFLSPKSSSSSRRNSSVLIERLESRQLLAGTVNAPGHLVGGVDPYNMGKGDWIWQISSAMTGTGTSTVAGLATFLKDKGMKWIIVKGGDGNNGPGEGLYAQWNKSLIDTFHAAGIKIFGYHFTYGGVTPNGKNAPTTLAGEKAVRDKIMSFNPDGLIIDAEGEWEKNPNANRDAEDYAKTFKQKFPDKLLGHAPFPYVRFHKAFPYLGFGKWVDVVMPQLYWETISIAQTPEKIMADVNADWKALYAEFKAGGNEEAIKPIVPIGQGYNPSATKATPPEEITRFFDLMRNDRDPASPFGWNGASFWSVQHHTSLHWTAIGNGTVAAASGAISGSVFNDVDGDGIQDPGESAVSGRIIFDDTNGNFVRDGHEPFTRTNSAGVYKLVYRPAGTHIVRQEVPTGLRQTAPADLQPNRFDMTTGQQIVGKNFGATALAKVSGSVFHDVDGDGAREAGDPVLRWTVYADANKNGILDAGEISTVANRKGAYALTLPAGSYDIRQIPEGNVFRTTNPGLGYHPVDLAAGQALSKMFGNTTLILIQGTVYRDRNRDGAKQGAEAGLAGWIVFVDRDGDGVWDNNEESGVTNSRGKYRLDTLAAGSYRIQVLKPKSWQPTVPNTGARKITLAAGQTTSNKNFGFVPIA
ncbi:MAG: hypothetical protein QOE14_1096 [Humisphaera sp.]|nr:hypothetical protein [Humisphaera sp.]